MKTPGQVVLFPFPQADLSAGKLRPALLLGHLPGPYDDWWICMISSQLQRCQEGFDEIIGEDDADFRQSGLKTASVIRVGRVAVVEGGILRGSLGEISQDRLESLKRRLAQWLTDFG